jgi:hypothetical protein
MHSTDEFIAERKLVAEHPQKGHLPMCIRIGKPYPERNGERWACPVFVEGVARRGADIRGVDSLQALTLALHFAKATLQSLVDRGSALYWPDGQPTSIEQIFGHGA